MLPATGFNGSSETHRMSAFGGVADIRREAETTRMGQKRTFAALSVISTWSGSGLQQNKQKRNR